MPAAARAPAPPPAPASAPPPPRRRRWPRRLAAGLAALLLLAAGTTAGLLWWSLPPSQATPRIPGLSAPVEITLDRHGIPRIAAATEADAAAALGWLHARDRMFSMEMMRRGASGRLAEIAGPALLPNDRFVRTLGLARRAAADLAILPPATRAVLDAYAAGVNAWIAARGRFAAPEFILLGAPEPWRPEHSLLWGKVMGLWLSGNWRHELEQARLAATLPPDRLADLWPPDTSPGRPDALPAPAATASALPQRGADARPPIPLAIAATTPAERVTEPPTPNARTTAPSPGAIAPPPTGATARSPELPAASLSPADSAPAQSTASAPIPELRAAAPSSVDAIVMRHASEALTATPTAANTVPADTGPNQPASAPVAPEARASAAPTATPTAAITAPAGTGPDQRASAPTPPPALDPHRLSRLLAALPRFPGPGTLPDSASNAWTVSAARSASGAPLLASDPHLGFSAPILWYLARIDLADGRMLAGATSPGVPGVVIGRSRDLAWGFTTTHSDTQDVFVETPSGADAYETPDGPRPFAVREEPIAVRGQAEPVRLRVRETRHGPVISDLDPDGDAPGGRLLAVAMANLAPDDTSAAGLLALGNARTVAEGRAAGALITGTPQNLMLADRGGGIAMALTGRTPVRRSGDGTLPAPGADGSHDWTGWVAADALPQVADPPGGALANANNRVSPPGDPAYLGRDWFGDWRFRRIGELLAARPRHDAAGFAALQRDTVSLLARELVLAPDAPLRRAPRPADAATAAALDLLLAWNGDVAADRPEPLVFEAWMRAAQRLALAAGGAPPGAGGPEFLRRVLSPDAGAAAGRWCDGDCAALAGRALAESVAALQPSEGADPRAWRWGRVHVARFEHPILRALPLLGEWTRLEAATGGDDQTVGRGGMRGSGPSAWQHVHGAGLRLVADLADPDATLAVIATGQSGRPLSAHWGDLLPLWRDGGTVALGCAPDGGSGRFRLLP
jgi:penicillin amidase